MRDPGTSARRGLLLLPLAFPLLLAGCVEGFLPGLEMVLDHATLADRPFASDDFRIWIGVTVRNHHAYEVTTSPLEFLIAEPDAPAAAPFSVTVAPEGSTPERPHLTRGDAIPIPPGADLALNLEHYASRVGNYTLAWVHGDEAIEIAFACPTAVRGRCA